MTDDATTSDGTGPSEFPTEADLRDEAITVDDVDPFDVNGDEYDSLDEFAVAEWKESTTADERIRAVVKHTTRPKSAADVAEEAAVSVSKARDSLNSLVEEHIVRVEQTSSGKRYERDPDWHLLRQIHRLAKSDTLVDQIQRVKRELRTYHDEYGSSDPESVLISDRDLSAAELEDVSHWRTAQREFALLRTAYRFRQAREQTHHTPRRDEQGETSGRQSARQDADQLLLR